MLHYFLTTTIVHILSRDAKEEWRERQKKNFWPEDQSVSVLHNMRERRGEGGRKSFM